MKLGFWPLELAFGLTVRAVRGRYLEYKIWLVQLYELMQFNILDAHNTCKWITYILMPRVGAMGMQEQGIKGVYQDSKHKIRGQTAA